MVDAVNTTVATQMRSLSGASPVRGRVNVPDTPVREVAAQAPIDPASVRALASGKVLDTGQGTSRGTSTPTSRPATPLVGNSALTTYRDQDSGRLIVRVFDRQSGDVLMEFPPEGAREIPRSIIPAASPKPLTEVDA
jgi:hypothetical protein